MPEEVIESEYVFLTGIKAADAGGQPISFDFSFVPPIDNPDEVIVENIILITSSGSTNYRCRSNLVPGTDVIAGGLTDKDLVRPFRYRYKLGSRFPAQGTIYFRFYDSDDDIFTDADTFTMNANLEFRRVRKY